jgi:large subunit ribosomal protein L14e
MFEIGRVCVKIAGRDAGQKCVIVDVLDDKFVLIDGMTRRRKCNKLHLEPINQTVGITANASHEDVAKVFKELGLDVKTTKAKERTVKPKAVIKTKEKPANAKPKKEKAEKSKTEKSKKPAAEKKE